MADFGHAASVRKNLFISLTRNGVLCRSHIRYPLGALALTKGLRLDEPLGVGLPLLGCAAGAPFLPKLAELSKGNLPFAVGTMVLLMVITVVYVPLVLPLLLPGIISLMMPGPAQPRQERVLSENAIPTGMTATADASVAGGAQPMTIGSFRCSSKLAVWASPIVAAVSKLQRSGIVESRWEAFIASLVRFVRQNYLQEHSSA
jgi:predicted Na+-dependent transporter